MPSFRVKRGRCHLDDGRLRLESSFRGQFRRYREGNRLLFWSYLAVLASVPLLVVALLLAGDVRTLLLLVGGVGVVLGVGYVNNQLRGFTSDDEIPLDAVTRVRAVEGTRGLTRPRFVVIYERDGNEKRRYVMMPSTWLSYGEAEFERAKDAFRDAGLPVETA